ncbi:MAG: DUF2812 domain-containing protein [Ruminococcaceae bacterium]|nr:DUF2812 domain-containing protein [Oscillospiraceae bacterium]
MKETMTKRFFAPVWKCDEIEAELSRLEKEGWRLDKISGFRKFEFTRATPKDATYFFTYWEKGSNMYDYEASLRREYKALPIKGFFIAGGPQTHIHRIPQDVDLAPYKRSRNFFLRYLVLQYIWVGLIFFSLSALLLIISDTVAEVIFSAFLAFIWASMFFPNFYGWIYLRKQYKNFGNQSNTL